MKKLLLAMAIFAYSATANASADFTVTWDLPGLVGVNSITIDLTFGNDFIAAHGGVNSVNGLTLPATGTCFLTAQGGIQCNLEVGQGVTGILDIGPTLNGTWRTNNANGLIVESSGAFVANIR